MCYIQFDYCCVSLGKEILVDMAESIGRTRELGFKSSKDGAQDNLGLTIVWRSVNRHYAVAGLQTQRAFRSIWRDMIDERCRRDISPMCKSPIWTGFDPLDVPRSLRVRNPAIRVLF